MPAAYIPLLFLSLLVVTFPVVTLVVFKYIRPALAAAPQNFSLTNAASFRNQRPRTLLRPLLHHCHALRDLRSGNYLSFSLAILFRACLLNILLLSRCSRCLFFSAFSSSDMAGSTRKARSISPDSISMPGISVQKNFLFSNEPMRIDATLGVC